MEAKYRIKNPVEGAMIAGEKTWREPGKKSG
jgi:hypothetical protein